MNFKVISLSLVLFLSINKNLNCMENEPFEDLNSGTNYEFLLLAYENIFQGKPFEKYHFIRQVMNNEITLEQAKLRIDAIITGFNNTINNISQECDRALEIIKQQGTIKNLDKESFKIDFSAFISKQMIPLSKEKIFIERFIEKKTSTEVILFLNKKLDAETINLILRGQTIIQKDLLELCELANELYGKRKSICEQLCVIL